MKKQSKMLEGIKIGLELIAQGEYIVDEEKGKMYNKRLKEVGKVGKDSGNVYYVIKGIDILAHRLLYAYYHGGIEALKEDMVIKHIDGNKQNNRRDNLVQLPRKGWKQALEEIKKQRETALIQLELALSLPQEVGEVIEGETAAGAHDSTLDEKEVEARRIYEVLLAGKTMKEVAAEFNVPVHRVYDIKRRKSYKKATADLPALA